MDTTPPPSYATPSFPPPSGAPLPPPPPPRRPAGRGRFAATVLVGALVVGGGAGIGGAAAWSAISGSDGPDDSGSFHVNSTPVAAVKPGSVESVAKSVLPSVVEIDVQGGSGAGSGSGVVLDRSGLILTNNHVVTLDGSVGPDQAQITVSFNDGSKAAATVVGTDPLTDTALIRVKDVSDLTPATIGSSANLQVGQQVVAIGSPYGLDSTVTSGIVSALDRPVDVGQDQNGNAVDYPAIQTDAAINPGNSGGALVDMAGHLVGINASIQTADDGSGGSGGQGGSIGLGFAIPVDEILPIVEQIKAGQTPTHARLGIAVSDAGQGRGQSQGFGGPTGQGGRSGSSAQIPDGAQIQQITDGSAAGDAGLRAGDIITGIDDHHVTGSNSLIATIRAYRPGERVKVTYQRDGKEHSTELELGSDGGS